MKLKKLVLIVLAGLFVTQPTTYSENKKALKPIKVSLTLTGLKIKAFGFSKEIAAFKPKNAATIEKWLQNTNNVIDWIENKKIAEKSFWLLTAKGRKKVCAFLQKQKTEIKKSQKKLRLSLKFGKIAKYLPFIGSCAFVCTPLLKIDSRKQEAVYARACTLPIAYFLGCALEKYLKVRLELAEKLLEVQKKIEQLIEKFQKAEAIVEAQAAAIVDPIKKKWEKTKEKWKEKKENVKNFLLNPFGKKQNPQKASPSSTN